MKTKSARARRSTQASRGNVRKVPGATRRGRGTGRGTTGNAHAERERALAAREESMRRREHALAVREAVQREREASARNRANVDRLTGQIRDANERLIVAAVRAQNLSDEAQTEAKQAREDLAELINQLRDANDRLAASAAQAHTMAEEAERREEEYRRLSNRLLTLQDEERRRLALELHDTTGQWLAALLMNLDVIGQSVKRLAPRPRRALAESRALAEQCSREIRTFAYLLHPPLLEEAGLLSAMRWYAEGFAKRSGIRVAMDLCDIGRLPRPIETALFRIVQESLTNIHRHSRATTASIRLATAADAVSLEIQDQGRGLSDDGPNQTRVLVPETLGVGIKGMRERIRQLGGMFDIEFTDTGTTVRVGVPVHKGERV